MYIDKEHLLFDDFIKNEINSLGFIQGLLRNDNLFADLQNKSECLFHQYRKKKNIDRFDFGCEIVLLVEGKKRKVLIEAIVTLDFSIASYVFSILEEDDDSISLLRKFHYDYAPKKPGLGKPVYHIQYGGKATPKMKELNVQDELINPWLSSPRLNTSPINLALFIDMIFSEFASEETTKIIEKSEWRDFIKGNEEKVLKKYFGKINNFFGNEHNSNRLFRDFYYGN